MSTVLRNIDKHCIISPKAALYLHASPPLVFNNVHNVNHDSLIYIDCIKDNYDCVDCESYLVKSENILSLFLKIICYLLRFSLSVLFLVFF